MNHAPAGRAAALAAALLAVLTALAGAARADWPSFGHDAAHTGFTRGEPAITPGTAQTLHRLWSSTLQKNVAIDTTPVFAAGVRVPGRGKVDLVYAGTEHGRLAAIDAATGRVVWSRNLPTHRSGCRGQSPKGGIFGITGAPAVDRRRGALLVAPSDDRLYALDLATGRTHRGWPVTITKFVKGEHVWGGITLAHGRAYVATASYCDLVPWTGRVVAISLGRHRVDARWQVIPGGHGGSVWGYGGVSVDPRSGDVFAATGNAIYGREDRRYGEAVVRLTPNLKVKAHDTPREVPHSGDADFGAFPLVFRPPGCPPRLVAMQKIGKLLLYDPDHLGRGPQQVLQLGNSKTNAALGLYAYSPDTRTVYLANGSDSDRLPAQHGLLALRVADNCELDLIWQQTQGPAAQYPSAPTILGDVVLWSDGVEGGVYAADATTGALLWHDRLGGSTFAAPSAGAGRVYFASWDGRVTAYGP